MHKANFRRVLRSTRCVLILQRTQHHSPATCRNRRKQRTEPSRRYVLEEKQARAVKHGNSLKRKSASEDDVSSEQQFASDVATSKRKQKRPRRSSVSDDSVVDDGMTTEMESKGDTALFKAILAQVDDIGKRVGKRLNTIEGSTAESLPSAPVDLEDVLANLQEMVARVQDTVNTRLDQLEHDAAEARAREKRHHERIRSLLVEMQKQMTRSGEGQYAAQISNVHCDNGPTPILNFHNHFMAAGTGPQMVLNVRDAAAPNIRTIEHAEHESPSTDDSQYHLD